ncbi:mediator of DNA damage checkpoint protein 1 isoform X11 [Ooceraea biroi]|uniref:mediator of DNA damage checkpoint protein 1 isoform X11 n=1 Tax=Ooceraea biroi TaxID=2015173 RepID=UPI000F08D4CD|nr:mediator of DNA damage checkpoint protein 1 isoform X11 [Ooceraea biroi]
MPANKSNLSTPRKEKSGNGLIPASTPTVAAASRKKKRSAYGSVKHKKHCKQYLQLHSEYRSTYTWHEYTGPQEHMVVRRAPQPPSTKQPSAKLQSAKSTEDENSEGPTLEPPLPRRKKCPALAYRTHEFITAADGGGIDVIDSNVVADKEVTVTSALPPSQLSKAISRISTEYRLQFAWPRKQQLMNGETQAPIPAAGGPTGTAGPPRKSLSMGALKQGMAPTGLAPVHKKRPGDFNHKRDGVQASELEPLVGGIGTDTIDGAVPEGDERDEDLSDLKITFRSKKYDKTVRISDRAGKGPGKSQVKPFPTAEMIELRRLADEYKHRDWGCGLAEDEASLWKQVSSNHALNALSLARSVTKEEKEKENTRKVMPIASMVTAMPPAGRPSSVQARPIYGILQDDTKTDNDRAIARARKDFLIRHHLDRTTGVGDGALLPSPTREKLEPVIPRRREDVKEHRDEIQPRTKSSPKNSPRTGRSQSLGPTVTDRRSPKRQPARAPSISKDAKEKEKETKDKDKDQRERSGERERHPRPMTAEPQLNGDVTGGDSSVASTPPSQTTQGPPASTAQPSPWLDDEPVVKSPPEPTRVKSPEQMIMRSPEPVNWTVPLDTGKTFTVTQNVREEPLTRPHSEAKTWAPSSVPSAPQSAPPELAAQHKSQHSQHSGYKSPESESVSLGSFSGINGHKDLDSERDSPLPASAQDPPTMPEKVIDIVEETKERQSPEPSTKPATNLKRLEDPTFQVEKKESGVPMTTATTTTTVTSSASPQQQQQSYRILEAESSPQSGGGSASGGGNGSGSTISGYHVLEAPAIVPGSAQRSTASDVLEKARNRFDKFWGKGNNGNTEN